jgi:dTDP-4-amino-4,6-dideoxygalactose transaminase
MYRSLSSAAPANLPVAKKAANEVICLPIYPMLKLTDMSLIAQLIQDV